MKNIMNSKQILSKTVIVVIITLAAGMLIATHKVTFDSPHRTRRDIMTSQESDQVSTKETPEDHSLTALYETWNRDYPSPNHLHGASMDAYDRDYRFLKELKARNLFHTSVLTDESKLNEYGTAIRLTWGGDVSALHFFFGVTDAERVKRHQVEETVQLTEIGIGEVYGAQHILQTLQYLCNQFVDEYHWFILIKDFAYVNVATLAKVLDRLTPSTEIAISVDNEKKGLCSLEGGLIISQRLLSSMCPRLWECTTVTETVNTDLELTECMGHVAQRSCTSSKQISEAFHTNLTALGITFASSMGRLSEDIAFLYPVSPVDLFYDIHIHYTEQELHRTERQIHRLEEEVKSSQSMIFSENPKRRKYKSGDLDEVAIFDSVHKFINSTDQFYQYIDEAGKVYLDTCKLEKDDLTKDGAIYDTILQMAEDAVGPDADTMESFAYRLVKPNVGVEYQFFFIEERRENSKKPVDDKVYQVTILQPYDKLEIITKEIHPFTTINIVLLVDNESDIINMVNQLAEICSDDAHVTFICNLIVLFQTKENKELTEESQLELSTLKEKITFKMQLIRTDHDVRNLQISYRLISNHLKEDSLVVFVNPHLILTKAFLQRCILNSLEGKKAYFPIHFQLLPGISISDNITPFDDQDLISNKNGYWANAEYDTFCAYKTDTMGIDILPATKEELIDDLTVKGVDILRKADPGLLKVWDTDLCTEETNFDRKNCEKQHRYINLR